MWKELWGKLDPNLKEEYGYGFYQTSKKLYCVIFTLSRSRLFGAERRKWIEVEGSVNNSNYIKAVFK